MRRRAFAELQAELLDGFEQVRRQSVAFAQEEEDVALGVGVEAIARGGDVGGAAGGFEVFRVARCLADGGGDGAEVAEDDFGEQRVEIGEVAADGGGRHAQGDGEAVHGDTRAAETGEECRGGGDDAVLLIQLPHGGAEAVAWHVVGMGAEVAGFDAHGGDDRKGCRSWAVFCLMPDGGCLALRLE